jgi:large subunit ribosomal protein L3
MLSGLLGRKIGMTQIFTENGSAIPVTIIEAGPCVVTQIKTPQRDGYEAVQIGFGTKKLNTTRPELGHLGHQLPLLAAQRRQQQEQRAKARQEARARGAAATAAQEADADDETEEETTNLESEAEEAESQTSTASAPERQRVRKRGRSGGGLGPFQILREVKALEGSALKIGQAVDASIFDTNEEVDVIGTSKGKGFAGVMKRHGFRGGSRTHGQSDRARAPGSIGAGTTPGRVLKGTRMAGHMGNERVTVKKLRVVQADATRNLLIVKGSIPGPNGGIVLIRKQVES